MGKMKEVFMDEREFENTDHDDDAYFYEAWKESQVEPLNPPGGDEDFIDFVDEFPPSTPRFLEVDDSNEY